MVCHKFKYWGLNVDLDLSFIYEPLVYKVRDESDCSLGRIYIFKIHPEIKIPIPVLFA
jgi:hypothetical protein